MREAPGGTAAADGGDQGGGNVGKVKIPVVLSGGTYGRLLVDPAIQQELELTPQVEKVREVIARLQQGDADVLKENPPGSRDPSGCGRSRPTAGMPCGNSFERSSRHRLRSG